MTDEPPHITDDPFEFVYDRGIVDKNHGIRIDVTVCDPGDDAVQIRIMSGTLTIPFFLSLEKAGFLAAMLNEAVTAATENADV